MTLLSIVQNIADEAGAQKPLSVVGNTDETAVKLLRAASREGRRLAKRYPWSVLIREQTIATAASTETYALPTDFDRYEDDTAWDSTNFWKMKGSLGGVDWQYRKNAIVSTAVNRRVFRVRYDTANTERRIFIHPIPTSIDSLVIEYISSQWCESSVGAGQTDWAADTDVGRLDETLIELGTKWRFLNMIGMQYFEELEEYKQAVLEAIGQDTPSNTINMGEVLFGFANLPEGNFG